MGWILLNVIRPSLLRDFFRYTFGVSTFFICLFVLCACHLKSNDQDVDLTSDTDKETQDITGGRALSLNDFGAASAVMIYGEKANGESYICSGVIISNSAILTAAHCIAGNINSDNGVNKQTGKMSVYLSVNPFFDRKTRALHITSILINPQYSSHQNDLAIIHFSDVLPNYVVIAKIGVSQDLDRTDSVWLLGYGSSDGSVDADSSEDIGALRGVLIAKNKVKNANDVFLKIDQRSGKGACFGDSGGPLLIRDSVSGDPILIGIAANIKSLNRLDDACRYQSFYTRLESFHKWILDNRD